ncbi:ubiquinone biosynthesis monooxygenase COQ6, mitochondrial [Microplitis demolitor]|uniref:ubiquinone biosynthesis monooxygenase COQ6, mitochondrial n=1 Tax=Microplitis demolitor TaxID=69319 RepID=UPI0004CD1B11|nr:ubiquinone biosynthesis monooxygenase COQ6, mitochondrial [Microplitis demolitor]
MAFVSEMMPCSRGFLLSLCNRYSINLSNQVIIARKHHCVAGDNDKHHDIIIAGGGMVGTTLAVALANNRTLQSQKILLLEGGNKHEYKQDEKYSNRVVALNQQTRTLLSSIGAWKHIEAGRYAPVRKMQVWDACSDAMITFNEDHLSEDIAYIVENDLLLHAVNKQVEEKPSVKVIYNAKVEDIVLPKTDNGDAKIKLQSGEEFTSKLLIGADGINSRVRQAMNVQYVKWEYDQMGIVATVELSEPTENIVAWQRFLPTGPVALLPLTSSLSSLVWSMTTKEAKRLLKIPEEEFIDELNSALWKVYPKSSIVESGMKALKQLLEQFSLQTGESRQLQPSVLKIVEESRAAFPLGFGHSTSYVANGVALVGDAAHRVHPLAGQGVNLGFGDVSLLVKLLDEALRSGSTLGDIQHLSTYETLRQRHNVPTMLAIDALHRLYKGTAPPIILARSLGLQLINAIGPVKKILMEHAANSRIIR